MGGKKVTAKKVGGKKIAAKKGYCQIVVDKKAYLTEYIFGWLRMKLNRNMNSMIVAFRLVVYTEICRLVV